MSPSLPIEEAVDGYHSNTDGNLTHTGTTEFVQLSPALKKFFFTRPVDVFPQSLKYTHTHRERERESGPKTFTYFRGKNF